MLNTKQVVPIHGFDLTRFLHSEGVWCPFPACIHHMLIYVRVSGVNMRYLAVLRAHTTDPRVRSVILVDMVTRISKLLLRSRLRAIRSMDDAPVKEV